MSQPGLGPKLPRADKALCRPVMLLSFPFSLSLLMQREPLEDLGLPRKRLKGKEGNITGLHKALSSSILLDGSLSLV